MINPIIERELIGILRTRKALALQLGLALTFALLVLLRWPTDARVDLSGAQSRQVFRAFGYGLTAAVILLVPAFPATAIVRERLQNTLSLLLDSPMKPWSIYFGKLGGVLGFVLLLMMMSLPAATACYAMGGITLTGDVVLLYAILALLAVQYAVLGLMVSSFAASTDSALRVTYSLVLFAAVFTMAPHMFLQGKAGLLAEASTWLRCFSPIPAIMELLDQADVGSRGLISASGTPGRFVIIAAASTVAFIVLTLLRLSSTLLDRPRSQGVVTDDRSAGGQAFRRIFFLVDPKKRKSGIGPFVNPVMIKEFRSRRFGRFHWMLRLFFLCAVISLMLTYTTTSGTIDWEVENIATVLVILQSALILLVTPSLSAGMISSERESGNWQLLQMTPLSAGVILRGKLASVLWTLMLILLATLPGYLVILFIEPAMFPQVQQVLLCLLVTMGFAVLLSATVSSLFQRTAPATATAYTLLFGLCAGTLVFWLGRDAPFGHSTVEAVLRFNPVAAALSVIDAPDFTQYNLVPANWWIIGSMSCVLIVLLLGQTWRLTRPQ